jgi:hypothetical protein
MNWIDHSMGWGWPGILLMWIVSIILIVGLVNILSTLMNRESQDVGGVHKERSTPITWLNNLRMQFNDWRRANAVAHAKAKPGACCSAPPPGAGNRLIH